MVETDYSPTEFRNWSQYFGNGPWRRRDEGQRHTWSAGVEQHDEQWWARVHRRPGSPRARLRVYCGGQEAALGDGVWIIGPFTSAGRAIAFTERWITVRRDPTTWRALEPVIPPGDHYTLYVIDEERALEWPDRLDGIERR